MEQKDYLLREIEKLGMIMHAIRQKLFSGTGNLSVTIQQQFREANEMLMNEANFDIEHLMSLDPDATIKYILHFNGLNTANIELLAGYIAQIGFSDQSGSSEKYLRKALELYLHCNLRSKTFSVVRENEIQNIKSALK